MAMVIPSRFRPGAKALIVHQGKILVVRENIKLDHGTVVLYDFPGGGLELGETVEQALHREVFEEVGLKIEVVKPLGSWDFMVKKPSEPAPVHIICLGFQCRLVGEAKIDTSHNPADEDIFETIWLTPQKIKAMPVFEWSADIRPILKNLSL